MSVISSFYAESSAVVQGKSCVVRAVSHGSDVDRSGGSCVKHTSPARLARSQPDVGTQRANVVYPGVDFSMANKPVFLSSGLAVSNEHAVEVVDPDFHAESSAVVQGKSCVERAVSHGFDVALSGGTCGKDTSPARHARSHPGVGTQFAHVGYPRVDFAVEAVVPGFPAESSAVSHGVDVAMSGGSCGKGTSPAYLARSQPGVSTQCAHVGYPGVELVSRATYISRKKRYLETVQRQSKALKKAQRDAKRKFVAQPEISHEAAELILRNQVTRTDEKFPGTIHVSHHLALLHGHENVFSAHSVVPSTLVEL